MPKTRTGHVFERDGRWFARFDYTDESGCRRNVKRRAKNKSEAKDLLKKLLRQFEDHGGTTIENDKLTFIQYFEQWLQKAAKPRLSERTFSDYEDLFRRYINPSLGRKRLHSVKPLDVQALYTDMQERGLSPRTVRYTHAVLSSAFKQAVRWGMIIVNPATLVELPKQIRKEMQALSPKEAVTFLRAAAQDRFGVLFSFALVTGTRPEEYLALQWKDIDFDRELVTISRTLCWRRRGGGWYFGDPKTARSRRNIPLPFSVAQALKEHKRKQSEERLKAGMVYQKLDLVFATSEGGPLMPQNLFRRHFKPILRRAGLPETIRLYDLRHSCATLLLAQNENPKVVSERLGHASITLTLDTYSHVLPSMQREATRRLESLLFETEPQNEQHKTP